MDNKKCGRCKNVKDICEFHRDKQTSSGFMNYCKQCCKVLAKTNYIRSKEKIDAAARRQRDRIKSDPILLEKHREYNRIHAKERRKIKEVAEGQKRLYQKNRLAIIEKYSNGENCCQCCKDNNIEFLTVDHINGGGRKHRKEVGNFFAWLKRNNYPPGFRILCMNCNFSMGKYGYCPHAVSVNSV